METPEQGIDAPMDVWFESNYVGCDLENDPHGCLYAAHERDADRPFVVGEWLVAGMEDLRVWTRVEEVRTDWSILYFPYADRSINP